MKEYNKKLKPISQYLRKETTETEKRLWAHVRKKQILGLQFYRQKPIGKYVVDFYCPRARLVIEIDGSQHFERIHEKKDQERDAFLEALGLEILRCTNLDVFHNIEGLVDEIFYRCEQRMTNSPQSPFD